MEKTNKYVSIYEMMYDVCSPIHFETAYGGRNKHLDSSSSSYRWDINSFDTLL